MSTNWRISSFNGALLAAYFIPTWTIVAFKIMISPIHGLYERPNISVALFISDHLQLAALNTVRFAWLLALGKLTVVAFFALFVVLLTRASIRKSGGCDEALGIALAIGSVISFASMVMASQVGESAALRLHATELLLLLGTAIVLVVERPAEPQPARSTASSRPVAAACRGCWTIADAVRRLASADRSRRPCFETARVAALLSMRSLCFSKSDLILRSVATRRVSKRWAAMPICDSRY